LVQEGRLTRRQLDRDPRDAGDAVMPSSAVLVLQLLPIAVRRMFETKLRSQFHVASGHVPRFCGLNR
jgi:hypothetical protein